jgi:hypothetical protein
MAASAPHRKTTLMQLILLEALLALVVLVLIVWWTMFSGRPKGEPPSREDEDKTIGRDDS